MPKAPVVLGLCRETDLVIGDDMDGTTTREVRQLAKAKGLIRGTLTREGRVSMALNIHH